MNEIQAVGAEAALEPSPADAASDDAVGEDRPWLFAFLIAPSAVVANGVVQGGVLAYLLSRQGVGSGGQSHMIFLLGLPTWLYFLWSPVTDFIVQRRTWVLLGGLLAAGAMLASFHQAALSSRAAVSLMFLSACCCQLVVSSSGGMMGAMRSERSRRVASSFYQAGGMGFGALAAWALVKLSDGGATRKILGVTAAAMIAVPALFALLAPKQEVISEGTFAGTMQRVWMECKATFNRWEAVPYICCMLFPMGSGAAIGLLPGVAQQFSVNGNSVAWMNGLAGGLLVAAGSATASILPTRIRAVVMYMLVCLVNCAALCVLWLGPLRPSTYFIGVTLYLFTIGTCYSMFTAVLLEFMGHSGKSGSGRYSIINSLGNLPVQYMLLVDGWGGDKWGGRGLAGSEAVVGAVGATMLLGYFLTHRATPADGDLAALAA
jgi:PAT family beta-lactamase induction signal transducer AmpG